MRVGGLELAHPVLNASGTWDAEQSHRLFGEANPGLAGFVTKTVTPEPRAGNPAPRIATTASGLLNSIGLPNVGRTAFLTDLLPFLQQHVHGPVICSVGGFSLHDYVETIVALDGHPGCSAIELNVSCPNVETGCASIGADADETERLVLAARAATAKPLFAKLSASVSDIAEIAQAAEAGGADAVVCINTVKATVVDRATGASRFGGGGGGYPARRFDPLRCMPSLRFVPRWRLTSLVSVASGRWMTPSTCWRPVPARLPSVPRCSATRRWRSGSLAA